MNQIATNVNKPYNPQAPGAFLIDAVITLEGTCHLTINKDNLNSWHQSRLTGHLCQELHRQSLNRTTPEHIAKAIKVYEDKPEIASNSLPGQLIIKAFITPEGGCYHEIETKNLDSWHFTKLTHFISQKINEHAFEVMTYQGVRNAQPNN